MSIAFSNLYIVYTQTRRFGLKFEVFSFSVCVGVCVCVCFFFFLLALKLNYELMPSNLDIRIGFF